LRAATLAVLLLVATAAPARADEEVVGLLEVRGDGVDQDTLDRFAEAVEDGLGAIDWVTAPRDRLQEMLAASSWTPACIVGPCLREVRAQTGADYVVNAGLAASGMSYRFTLTLIGTETGAVIAQKDESCPACTIDDVIASVTIATIALVNEVPPAEAPPAPPPERRNPASTLRRTGLLFLGVSLVAGAVAYYLHDKDRDDVGYPLAGAAGGLALSGAVVLGISLRF
jgi:hypothetical protein